MKFKSSTYSLSFDLLDQQVDFEGIFRPASSDETVEVLHFLERIHDQVEGLLRLSFRRLRYINAEGVHTLSRFISHAKSKDRISIQLVASAVLAWSEHILPNLVAIWDKVDYQVHDRNFYKSQGIIEDLEFIPLLRNQTRILWPVEREILRKHGLVKGMRVADICCGCGDIPLLISRELHPSFIMGVDHSEAAMEYARTLQHDFAIKSAEFQRGDATALMLQDDSFDFVLCRLSLQIFSKPEQILKELIRITKPGGRVYTLCEDYDLIVGHPESLAIRETYQRTADYGAELGVDLRSGKKLYSMLSQFRLEDIQTDHITVDSCSTNREAFSKVIQSWRQFAVYTVGDSLKLDRQDQDSLAAGYDAHLRILNDPAGYTTWAMVACSGRKPLPGEPS